MKRKKNYFCSQTTWSYAGNSKDYKKLLRKTISFRIASQRITYLEISGTKEMNDSCTKNHNTFLKEIVLKNTNKWKDTQYSWTGKLILSKAINRFNIIITIKFPMAFIFCRSRQLHPKIPMKSQGIPNSQNDFEKEEQNCRYHTS